MTVTREKVCVVKKEVNAENVENVCLQGAGNFGFNRYQVIWWKGWLEARPFVERVPLMHWIEERRKKRTSYI